MKLSQNEYVLLSCEYVYIVLSNETHISVWPLDMWSVEVLKKKFDDSRQKSNMVISKHRKDKQKQKGKRKKEAEWHDREGGRGSSPSHLPPKKVCVCGEKGGGGQQKRIGITVRTVHVNTVILSVFDAQPTDTVISRRKYNNRWQHCDK